MPDSFVKAVTFDLDFVAYLTERGVENVSLGTFPVHSLTEIEPPVSLYGIDIWAFPARIGAFTYFGPGQFFNAQIGRYCSVGAGLRVGISQHPTNHLTTSPLPYVKFGRFETFLATDRPDFVRKLEAVQNFDMRPRTHIGNDVWIGADVYIKDGLTIGDGAIIGAHAVVTRDVPPYHIVAGNPARVIRLRFPETVVERLLKLEWWKYNLYEFQGVNTDDIQQSIDRIEELTATGLITPYAPRPVSIIKAHDEYLS
jgi:virginiamycin A acetyltransferase